MARRKMTAIKNPMTKTAVLSEISEHTGLTKREVASVFDELGIVIERHVKRNSCGTFTLPGLLKIKTVKKPARKAQKNVPIRSSRASSWTSPPSPPRPRSRSCP